MNVFVCLFVYLSAPVSSCASPPQTVHPTAPAAFPDPPALLSGPGSSVSTWSDWCPATQWDELFVTSTHKHTTGISACTVT